MLNSSSRCRFSIALIAVFAVLFATVAQGMPTDAAAGQSLDSPPEGLSQGDWQSIRTAYEHNRHAVSRVEADDSDPIWRADNPGQRYASTFDGRGVQIRPEHGRWEWGLELKAWGSEELMVPADAVSEIDTEDRRTVYAYADGLEEWYVNHQRGLEHGFTVQRPPRGDAATLRFEMRVLGGLAPRISDDRRNANFVDGDGNPALDYGGLKAWDADGKALPARVTAAGNELALVVETAGARYPVTVDPVIQQQAYLKASNTDGGDRFGWSVAVSGDTVVVGAPRESSSAEGVSHDPDHDNDNNISLDSGAAYVFVRDGNDNWSQQAYLKASNTDADDWFGYSVAVSGDTVVVGAPYEDSGATGVDGEGNDNTASDSGAAYVFARDGNGAWSQQAYLKASYYDSYFDEFGHSVAVSGDTVVVGARWEDSGAPASGAAYVFARDINDAWSQQAHLKASNAGDEDLFGRSVAVSGDTVLVGAPYEDSGATGVDGDDADDSVEWSGAAYVFARDNNQTWSQQAYLKASNTNASDRFGHSVAVSGDTVVVGARSEDSDATGVIDDPDHDNDNNNSLQAGAAYVFVRNDNDNWSQQVYLKASNTDAADEFGNSVAVSGDTVVVGASFEHSAATGVDGNETDNSANLSGAAYVFVRDGNGGWSQRAYLKASNTDASDRFGHSVAVSGETVVVGARVEGSDETGVSHDPDHDNGNNNSNISGAAYVFAPALTIGGTVSGLSGSGLALLNDGEDSLAITTNGSFTFDTPLEDLSAYEVTIGSQPTDPSQTCVVVANGSGTLNGADVTDVQIECTTDQFTVGGTVTGLEGSGLALLNNGGDSLTMNADGSFTFATPLDDLSAYEVTIGGQPTDPSQTCTVTNGSGQLASADVSNVQVACDVDLFTVGGTVSGLSGSGLVLHNNGGDDLSISADGPFTFATALEDGSAYTVTVATQPEGQRCQVANADGTLNAADVTDVAVTCGDRQVALSSDSLDFGSLTFNHSASAEVTLTNTGEGGVDIAGVDLPTGPFSITGGDCLPSASLLPGETCTIEITFEPGSAGDWNVVLGVESNAANSPAEVALRGTAQAPIAVPATGFWTLMVLALLLLVSGKAARRWQL